MSQTATATTPTRKEAPVPPYYNHDDVFNGEDETYIGRWPWANADEVPCELCKKSRKGGCSEHAHGMPKDAIPYPLDLDVILPCVGLHDEYDEEIVTPEIDLRCGGCPAADWCLQWAVANNEEGIWAGTNTQERRVMGLDARREREAA